MAESDIRTNIMAGLRKTRKFDGYAVHGGGLQRMGEPDLTGEVWLPTLGIWGHLKLECKTPIGEASVLQRTRLREYHKRGYIVGVVRSIKEAEAIIASYEQYWSLSLNVCEPIIDILEKHGYTVLHRSIYGG